MKRSYLNTFFIVCVVVCLAGGTGCGEKSPYVPVSGVVTLDGKPLEGADVSFRSEQGQFGGITGPDGRYELKPGALPGAYKVDIIKYPRGGGSETHFSPKTAADAGPPVRIPPRYSDPKQTVLSFMVERPGTDKAHFSLGTRSISEALPPGASPLR